MDLDIDDFKNVHSPCVKCYMNGNAYLPDNNICKTCEYSVSVQILRKMMYEFYGCSVCKNRKNAEEVIVQPLLCHGGESELIIDWGAFIQEAIIDSYVFPITKEME